MKTYRKISKKFEWTIEKKPTKQYLNISSIPGNARPSAYILRKKNSSQEIHKLIQDNDKMLFLPMDKLQLMLKMMYELVASMMLTSKNVCKPGAFSFRYHLTKMAEAVPESVARI